MTKKIKEMSAIASVVRSVGLVRMKGDKVLIEANVRPEKNQLIIVGLPDLSIKESKESILSCIDTLDINI